MAKKTTTKKKHSLFERHNEMVQAAVQKEELSVYISDGSDGRENIEGYIKDGEYHLQQLADDIVLNQSMGKALAAHLTRIFGEPK